MGQDATKLLTRATTGDDAAAEELFPLVYDELRRLAAHYFRQEKPGHTLQPTALVHEAYLRLIRDESLGDKGRTTFFGIAAREIRRLLIEHARKKNARKRGGDWRRVPLEALPATERVDLIMLEDLLEKLSELNQRMARIAELRIFGGLTEKEIADTLEVSERTAHGDWRAARAWLQSELKNDHDT